MAVGDLMARITFSRQADFQYDLTELEKLANSEEFLERAVAKGAAPVADSIRAGIQALPAEDFRRLRGNDTFHVITKSEKKDLTDGFGLTPISRDRKGFVNTKAGFDGYGSFPTKSYPRGVPNQLVARAVESGSSVREKIPFVKTAVRKSRKAAVKNMEESITDDLKKVF